MGSNANTDVDKLITFGQMALEQGWYDQARKSFEQALALDADNREAMKGLARVNEILSRRRPTPVEPTRTEPVEPLRKVSIERIKSEAAPAKPRRADEPTTTRKGKRRWLALALIPVVLIALAVASQHFRATPTPIPTSISTPMMAFTEAIERAQQATVGVGVPRSGQCEYVGSGVIVDSEGLIITNAHVVENAVVSKGEVFCCIRYGEMYQSYRRYIARVEKRDYSTDLALLRIGGDMDSGSPVSDLSLVSVPMGDSDKIHTGQTIYVCGYPEVGGYNVTVTRGVVSGFENNGTLIKTDTEISPGSSGGVAISENGLLIGIPTFGRIAPLGSGKIGYLIAVNEVRRFLQSYQGQ